MKQTGKMTGLASALALTLALALGGCVSNSEYMGIDLTGASKAEQPGMADMLQLLYPSGQKEQPAGADISQLLETAVQQQCRFVELHERPRIPYTETGQNSVFAGEEGDAQAAQETIRSLRWSDDPDILAQDTASCRQLHQQVNSGLNRVIMARTGQYRSQRTSSYRMMPLTELARMAQIGNKQAQLELGIRFEEGRGVERDLKKARKLYRLASIDTGGTIWVYSPPVGKGTSGRVIPLDTGPKQYGLAEAKQRLERLK